MFSGRKKIEEKGKTIFKEMKLGLTNLAG